MGFTWNEFYLARNTYCHSSLTKQAAAGDIVRKASVSRIKVFSVYVDIVEKGKRNLPAADSVTLITAIILKVT